MANMTEEQKSNMEAAKQAEATVLLIELKQKHVDALGALKLMDKRDDLALAAFNSLLKGKVKASMDKAKSEAFELLRKHGATDPQVIRAMEVVDKAQKLFDAL